MLTKPHMVGTLKPYFHTKLDIFFSQLSSIIGYFEAFHPTIQFTNELKKLKLLSLQIATDTIGRFEPAFHIPLYPLSQ